MLYKKFSLLYILLFVLASTLVCSVGIGQYNREKQVLFQSGLEKTYGFQLSDSLRISASIEGDLAQYAVINDPSPGGPSRNIEVYLKLPDFIDPGVHTLYVVATEVPSGTGTVGGISSVRVGMEVYALYPGKHPDFRTIETSDINVNGSTLLGLNVINYGEETINDIHGTISVYNPDDMLVAVLNTDSKSVAPYGTETASAILDTSLYNMSPGNYKTVGNLTYDNINFNELRDNKFIIGQMNINIVSSTPELFVNSTNKFLMNIESEWSGDIDNIYATIALPNGKTVKTPNVDLIKPGQGARATVMLESYVETNGLALGPQDFEVTLHYKGKSSTSKVTVNIVDGKPPETERPKTITPMTIFIAISVTIILFVAVYFLMFRKGGGHSGSVSSQTGQVSNAQQSSNDIRPPSL